MPGPDRAQDLALLEDAVREGGAIARSLFGTRVKAWDKAKGSPVTEADLAVNHALHARLLGARPEYGWLSEESEDDPARLNATRIFVVDPIDGTLSFMRGTHEFTICAAIVEAGRPVVAAVFNPMTDEMFLATEGDGTTLNGASVRVSACDRIEDCRILGPKAMFAHPDWPQPWPPMRIETRASVAYRMALVAAGRFDAVLSLSSKHDWDIAAADLLVREAGGRVTTHRGDAFALNRKVPSQASLVAAGPALHALMLERVRGLTLP